MDSLILAIKGQGFAILAATDGNKPTEVYQNIFYSATGNPNCCEDLENSLRGTEFPHVNSVNAAARFVTNHINNRHSNRWAEEKRVGNGIDMLLVGNVINTDQYDIFRITKRGGAARDYEMMEINELSVAIGDGAKDEIWKMLGEFRLNSTLKEADALAFKAMRRLSSVVAGGEMEIIAFRKKDMVVSVVGLMNPEDPNSGDTVRTDTIHNPNDPNTLSVTYQKSYKI